MSINYKTMKTILKVIPLCLGLLFANGLLAQENPMPLVHNNFDLSISAGPDNSSLNFGGNLSFYRDHGLLKSKKLRLGYGLRIGGFGGSRLTYITAPARLTIDQSTIDTLMVQNPLSMYLNAAITAEYYIVKKFKVGFNIDLIGLGFGTKSDVSFISSENDGAYPTSLEAKPTTLNLLLIGDRDIGQVTSDFYVGYQFTDNIGMRAGLSFVFSEYTTDQVLTNDNDRFRYKAMMGFIALSYRPFIRE